MISPPRRNFSIHSYFQSLAARHRPRYRFEGTTRQHWQSWRDALLPAVKGTLGNMPPRVPLRAEVQGEWREHGLIKQRIVFDVEQDLSAAAYVFRPDGGAEPMPAILACHGHGDFGKDGVMGDRSSRERAENIEDVNYDYGLQMARAGFVTMAIDWRGFGERDDRQKTDWKTPPSWLLGRDICNVHYLRATLMGMTLLGMNVHDGTCALDYLTQQSFVDPRRIGVMGLSFGGTMATWLAICDQRIRAANVICYSDRFADFAMRDTNVCGSQITPGLFALCDLADLHGLIAPTPLLIEIASYDHCFSLDSAMSCYREVEKIYRAAGASDQLDLDFHEGGHRWGANKSAAFFHKHLGKPT